MKKKLFGLGMIGMVCVLVFSGCDFNLGTLFGGKTEPATNEKALSQEMLEISENPASTEDATQANVKSEQIDLQTKTGFFQASQEDQSQAEAELAIGGATQAGSTQATQQKENPLVIFAKCLKSKGIRMYGAYWCPHCQTEKVLFGDAFQYVNYVECAAGQPNSNVAKCDADKIVSYPTWYYPKSGFLAGQVSLEEIAKLSGCEYQTK